MAPDKIKLAVFKPFNARTTNSFYSGQHPVFRYLQNNYDYEVTYFIDDKNVKFDTVTVKYIKNDRIKTFILRGFRKFFRRYRYYWKIPYYEDLDFSNYDIIITEGIHYPFLDYFNHINHRIILNDSISRNYILSKSQVKYLNEHFSNSLAVVVNDKIPILYRQNGIKIKTAVIGHGVQVENIPFLERKKFNAKIVSVGRLVPEKGFEYIIQAVRILKKQYPEIRLDIYGDGILREKLEKFIQESGLTNNIFLKGFLEYKQLLNKLNNYDLFVSHPLETSYIAEAFSMANMEAMANGMPVVTTNCGGVPYVVKGRAIVVHQRDVNGIAEAIKSIVDDPQKFKKYSVEGRKYVEEKFNIKKIAEKWDIAIRNFLNCDSRHILKNEPKEVKHDQAIS